MVQDEEELFWAQHLLYSNGKVTVLIPFVCFRCGKCCREVSIHPAPADIPVIARFLGISVEQFITDYLGEIIKVGSESIEFMRTKSWKPCPFLSTSNVCTIYQVRTHPCRSYPLHTDSGDRGIGCPGYKQVRRVASAIGQGVPYFASESIGKRPEYLEWKRIYGKFLRAKPSDEMTKAFIRLNNIPRELNLCNPL